MTDPDRRESGTSGRVFATTNWTLVLNAQRSDSPGGGAALDQLCRTYWYPLYAYVRRRGYSHPDAEDFIQGFFVHILDRETLLKVAPERGKFRSFLLASLNYFLADARDRNQAQKRGGGLQVFSLDSEDADRRYALEPADQRTPERLFERRWALAIIERVFDTLKQEYVSTGKAELFRELQSFLHGDKTHGTYADAAVRLGSSEGAVKMAVLRLRRRYRTVFREVIAQTVESPADVDAEFSYLISVISS